MDYIVRGVTKSRTRLSDFHFNLKKKICTSMSIAALFTIAKTWKQPKYSSMCEKIKKWHIYVYIHTHTVEYYSAIKSSKFPICRDIDGP